MKPRRSFSVGVFGSSKPPAKSRSLRVFTRASRMEFITDLTHLEPVIPAHKRPVRLQKLEAVRREANLVSFGEVHPAILAGFETHGTVAIEIVVRDSIGLNLLDRSEERRVGKECRARRVSCH